MLTAVNLSSVGKGGTVHITKQKALFSQQGFFGATKFRNALIDSFVPQKSTATYQYTRLLCAVYEMPLHTWTNT